MKSISAVVFGVVLAVVLMGSFAFAQQDAKGVKIILSFQEWQFIGFGLRDTDFDAEDFVDPEGQKKVTVEGRNIPYEYIALKPFEGKYSRSGLPKLCKRYPTT